MDRYVTKKGYLIKKDCYNANIIKKIIKELTITPIVLDAYKNPNVKPKSFKIYKESPNYYFLPIFYGRALFGKEVCCQLPEGDFIKDDIKIIESYQLMEHQIGAFNALKNACLNIGGGLLSLSCGMGKTFVSIYTAVFLKAKTIVIVNKEFLMDQWIDSINKFTGGKARIGIIQQDVLEIENKDFVIAMVHTISKKEFPDNTFDSFKLCIIDECHHLGSEFFSKSLLKIQTKYRICLSATPKRSDGCMNVVNYFMGPVCYVLRRTNINNVLVKRLKLKSNDELYETLYMTTGTKNTAGMITNLSQHKNRNNLIINMIKILMENDENRQILLLSGRREHLENIYKLLFQNNIKKKNNKNITFGYYYGNQGNNK